jgi:hypothetical protein
MQVSHREFQQQPEELLHPVQLQLIREDLLHQVLILSHHLIRLAEELVRIRQKASIIVPVLQARGVLQM